MARTIALAMICVAALAAVAAAAPSGRRLRGVSAAAAASWAAAAPVVALEPGLAPLSVFEAERAAGAIDAGGDAVPQLLGPAGSRGRRLMGANWYGGFYPAPAFVTLPARPYVPGATDRSVAAHAEFANDRRWGE